MNVLDKDPYRLVRHGVHRFLCFAIIDSNVVTIHSFQQQKDFCAIFLFKEFFTLKSVCRVLILTTLSE